MTEDLTKRREHNEGGGKEREGKKEGFYEKHEGNIEDSTKMKFSSFIL